jgi:hypothetical protein
VASFTPFTFTTEIDGLDLEVTITHHDPGRRTGHPDSWYPSEIEWRIDRAVDLESGEVVELGPLVDRLAVEITAEALDHLETP